MSGQYRRIGAALLGGVLAMLVMMMAVLPNFIDWNAHRRELAGMGQALLGRPVQIDGDIKLQIFPQPTLRASQVRLAVEEDGDGANVHLASFDARLDGWALLRGRIIVRSVALIEPNITLVGTRLPWPRLSGPAPLAAGDVSFDQVIIVNGRLIDGQGQEQVSGFNLELYRDIGANALKLSGDARYRDVSWRFEANQSLVGEGEPAGLTATLAPRAGGVAAKFTGSIRDTADGPHITGRVRAEGSGMAPWLKAAGMAWAPVLDQRTALEADLDLQAGAAHLTAASLILGDWRVTGTLEWQDQTGVALTLSAPRLDLDRLLTEQWIGPAGPPAWLRHGQGHIQATIDAALWRGGIIRQVRLDADWQDGAIILARAEAGLPGNGEISLAGLGHLTPKPRLDGRIEINADHLRGLLAWLGIDVDIAPDRLRRASARAAISLRDGAVAISDLSATIDSSRLEGEVTLALRQRPTIGASLHIDHLNLDAYLVGVGWDEARLALFTRFDGTADVSIGKLTWRSLPIDQARIDGTLRDGILDLRHLATDGPAAGDRVRLQGQIDGRVWPLRLDLVGTVALDEPLRVIRQLDGDVPNLPGSIAGSLQLKGSLNDLTLASQGRFGAVEWHWEGAADLLSRRGQGQIQLSIAQLDPWLAGLSAPWRLAPNADGAASFSAALRFTADRAVLETMEINLPSADGPVQGSGRMVLSTDPRRAAALFDLDFDRLDLADWLLLRPSSAQLPEPTDRLITGSLRIGRMEAAGLTLDSVDVLLQRMDRQGRAQGMFAGEAGGLAELLFDRAAGRFLYDGSSINLYDTELFGASGAIAVDGALVFRRAIGGALGGEWGQVDLAIRPIVDAASSP